MRQITLLKLISLKADTKGFKIVQLSDLHICASTTEDEIISIVDRVNALNPDVVVITGDFVDGQVLELSVKARHLLTLNLLLVPLEFLAITSSTQATVHGWNFLKTAVSACLKMTALP